MITRTAPHRTDTLAVRRLMAVLPEDWLVRSLEERDYGIDLMLEFFSGKRATGKIALIQVKGTEKRLAKSPTLPGFPVDTLLYAEGFSHPFFVFYVSVTNRSVHFVWLQKYIGAVLDVTRPKWRRQQSTSIHFPEANSFPSNKRKFLEIVDRYRRAESGLKFLANYELLKLHSDQLVLGQKGGFEPSLRALQRIAEDRDFLQHFAATPPRLSIQRLMSALKTANAGRSLSAESKTEIEAQMDELYLVKMAFLAQDENDEMAAECPGAEPY